MADLSEICHFSASAGLVSISRRFLWPKPTKPNNMESERDPVGHYVCLPHPIHRPVMWLSSHARTTIATCGDAQPCMMCSSSFQSQRETAGNTKLTVTVQQIQLFSIMYLLYSVSLSVTQTVRCKGQFPFQLAMLKPLINLQTPSFMSLRKTSGLASIITMR